MSIRLLYRLTASLVVIGLIAIALHLVLSKNNEPLASAWPDNVEAFLEGHWQFPMAPQGAPPDGVSSGEASLDAGACGLCHVSQYEDWRTSRHSQTMNPGIRWQFHVFSQAESNKCMDCHAPLAEQKALVAQELEWANTPTAAPPDYVPPGMHRQGLTCAACHVRRHERFGPEHRQGLSGTEEGLPHGGFHPRRAFSDSQFCAACHQFPDDGPRLNGKLRQDTYNEWLRSPFAEQGVTCQDCHMPNRRHLWRGIADPDALRGALAIQLHGESGDGEGMAVKLSIANVGAGHHFPSYIVPRIDVHLELLDPDGNVRSSVIHHVIQWRASIDLKREEFDTRLAAGESVNLDGHIRLPGEPGWSLELRLEVAPKEHYERMYADMMRQAEHMDAKTVDLLRRAIFEARQSRYRAVQERVPLEEPVSLTLRYPPIDSLAN
ncbi:multiheme c-type cytochrome [Thioalkalivibrio sp.]|uniref:multiheme c-type cytochrome n=1 Tax=Thioalkalivibrio sp. TaxID=2093813 RepID=UPI003974958D